MNERIERKRTILKLHGKEVREKLEALKLKEQAGATNTEEKKELKALKKRAEQMVNEVVKKQDRR